MYHPCEFTAPQLVDIFPYGQVGRGKEEHRGCGFSRLPLHHPDPPGGDPTTVPTGTSDVAAATSSFTGKKENSSYTEMCFKYSALSFSFPFFLRWITIYCVYEVERE